MTRSAEEFKARTKQFAKRVVKLVDSLPARRSVDVIGKQLLRSATSVGANYRAACRARSDKEFCAKLGIAEEEADESAYWMELWVECEIVKESLIVDLSKEANEITAMLVSSIKTARLRLRSRQQSLSNPQSEIRNPKSEIR